MKKQHKINQIIQNPMALKVLVFISMFYMCIMLCNIILTNKYIGTDSFFILGGTLTAPFIFILDDIVAEVYGYKITRCLIISGFISQTIFAFVCQLVLLAPYPTFFTQQAFYSTILGTSLLRFDFSGFFAYIIANLMNAYILTRWKLLLKGRKFWLRSIGSSAFSEAIYSFVAIFLMELNTIPLDNLLKVVLISYSIKVIYSTIFAVPAQLAVNYIKNITHLDVYELPKKFTPFQSLKFNMRKS